MDRSSWANFTWGGGGRGGEEGGERVREVMSRGERREGVSREEREKSV